MSVDIVAFGAHPDDVELTSGAFLLKMAAQGHGLAVVDFTRGEAATRGTPEIRAREAAAAAVLLGAKERINLKLPDGHLAVTPEGKRAVAEVIRRLRPGIVVAPYWKDAHPDHAAASQLVTEGCFMAGLRTLDASGEPWRPRVILYSLFHYERDFYPSFIVDVTASWPGKKKLAECYASQFYNPASAEPATNISRPDFWARIEARARVFGDMIGAEFGEAFVTKYPVEIDDPVEHYRNWRRTF